MLDLFLKLVDRIIQLADLRSDKRKELFKTLAEPSFDEASAVYSDYRKMLRNARDLIQQGDRDQAISNLETDREKYLATRSKLRSMATTIQPPNIDRIKRVSFAELVSVYASEIGNLIISRAEQDTYFVTRSRTLIQHLQYLHVIAKKNLTYRLSTRCRRLLK